MDGHLEGRRRLQILDIEREVQELATQRREEREQEAIRLREQKAIRLREQEAARLREQEAARLREQEAARLREQEAVRLREQEANRLREQKAIRLREQREQERLLFPNGPFMPERFTRTYPIRDRETDSNQQRIPIESFHWQVQPERAAILQQDERRPQPSAPQIAPWLENVSTNSYPYPQTDDVVDVERRIEQQRQLLSYPSGPHMPPRLTNSSTNQAEYRQQQITDVIWEAGRPRQAVQRTQPNAPTMPFRFNNSSITPAPNSRTNYYPFAPISPESEIISHLRFPDRPSSRDDGLPTYEEAIAIDYTKSSVATQLY